MKTKLKPFIAFISVAVLLFIFVYFTVGIYGAFLPPKMIVGVEKFEEIYDNSEPVKVFDNRVVTFKNYAVVGKDNANDVLVYVDNNGGTINRNKVNNEFLDKTPINTNLSMILASFSVLLMSGVFMFSQEACKYKIFNRRTAPAVFAVSMNGSQQSPTQSVKTTYAPINNQTSATNNQKQIKNPTVSKKATSFDDIAGYENTKKNMEFIVSALKNKALLDKAGAKIPHGIILYGPPGTGKTLMAAAIAGSAGVPFYSTNASAFINTYVGTGAAAIRELYAHARRTTPSVVFIDEIDAIGRQRGGSDNSEYRNTINALLAEIDGLGSGDGVITIAATNALESLDEALIRPGRFDRKIYIPLPNEHDRELILKHHCKNKHIEGISMTEIAKSTEGLSGSALATLMNEAAILAAQNGRTVIQKDDVNKALYQLISGSEEKAALTGRDALIVSYHEAGHALLMKKLCHKTVPRVSINTSSDGSVGFTVSSGMDGAFSSKISLENTIKSIYAGRAAEEIFFGNKDEITSGASDDIKVATKMIREYLTEYGMGDSVGLLNMEELLGCKGNTSEYLSEAKDLAQRLYQETLDFLKENREVLDKLAKALCEKQSLSNSEVDTIINA